MNSRYFFICSLLRSLLRRSKVSLLIASSLTDEREAIIRHFLFLLTTRSFRIVVGKASPKRTVDLSVRCFTRVVSSDAFKGHLLYISLSSCFFIPSEILSHEAMRIPWSSNDRKTIYEVTLTIISAV